jgi:hypothetical protein
MDLGDRAAEVRFLVRDRAGQFSNAFDARSWMVPCRSLWWLREVEFPAQP